MPDGISSLSKPLVLVVEDEAALATMLRYNLEKQGYRVEEAADGQEALTRIAETQPDLVLLDWMLPQMSGLEVCRQIRRRSATRDLPVIMVTARTEDQDAVRGLNTGADDYIAKPFSMEALLARIRALLRRSEYAAHDPRGRPQSVLTFMDWRLDLVARRLHSLDGTRVPLTGGEFELLVAFCEHANQVLTRDQLLDFTRGKAPAGVDRSIDIQVSRLRRKIEDDPKDPALIQTVRSGGYIFAAQVTFE